MLLTLSQASCRRYLTGAYAADSEIGAIAAETIYAELLYEYTPK